VIDENSFKALNAIAFDEGIPVISLTILESQRLGSFFEKNE